MNRWGEGSLSEVDVIFPRLVGYRFQIRDHPGTREQPLFATERGQLIVSRRFHEALSALHRENGGARPPGVLTAIARTP